MYEWLRAFYSKLYKPYVADLHIQHINLISSLQQTGIQIKYNLVFHEFPYISDFMLSLQMEKLHRQKEGVRTCEWGWVISPSSSGSGEEVLRGGEGGKEAAEVWGSC